MNRQSFVVVLRVLHQPEPNLLQVTLAAGATRVLTRACEDREKNRRKDSYNCDYDEKFDQGKAVAC